tara:strand:+ start:500 stop:1687 length:1188 start_codon:yes stop_codon:yes gene_type:complete
MKIKLKETVKQLFNYLKFKKLDENISEKIKTGILKENRKKLIIYIVGMPITVLILYFYFIGRDRYFVRSDIVVRSASGASSNIGLNSLLGTGNQGSIEDARFLRTYLESPQVLEDLEDVYDFKKAYKRRGIDLYAGIKSNINKEKKYNFFRKQIDITLNESSGIISIRSLGFTPEASFFLNNFLIKQSEIFVNKLNQDIYKRQLKFVDDEVLIQEDRLKKAAQNLSKFQRSNMILNAQVEGQFSSEFIGALEAELVKLKVDLAGLTRKFVNLKAPEIIEVKNQIFELENQINIERDLLVSPEGKNFSEKISKMNELEASLKFARDLYKTALTASERTRVDSLQQQRFTAILSKPQKPDSPWQYWRHKGFFASLASFLVSFGLIKFLIGMSDSHRN